MAIDFQQFRRNLTYTTTATAQEIMADLNAIAAYDKQAEKKQKQFQLLLWIAIAVTALSLFLLRAKIGFVTLPVGVIGVIVAIIMLQRYGRCNVPDHRYIAARTTLSALQRDMSAAAVIDAQISFSSPTQPNKKTDTRPHPYRSGWKIDYFTDSWLFLTGKFLDGSIFDLAVTEQHVKKYGWKRSYSGKSKYKSKTKEKGVLVELTLTVPRRKYGALPILREDIRSAVKLPPIAQLKGLKVSDRRLYLAAKLRPGANEGIPQVITMMFLSAYQVLNLARQLSKKTGT